MDDEDSETAERREVVGAVVICREWAGVSPRCQAVAKESKSSEWKWLGAAEWGNASLRYTSEDVEGTDSKS